MITPEKLKELRELAENAMPGPWCECQAQDGCGLVWSKPLDMPVATTNTDSDVDGIHSSKERKLRDSKFIAAIDPQTVLELLDEIERLQKEINNFLTYGQGGANLKESQLIDKLYKAERERDEARAQAAAMREALETFADARRWRYKHCWVYYGESPFLLAQQALSPDAGREMEVKK